jgi:hypothetical protein
MPQPTRDVTVKDQRYRIEGLPPALGVKAMTRIMRLAAPTLAKISEVVRGSQSRRAEVDKRLPPEEFIAAEIARNDAETAAKIDVGIKTLQQLIDVLDEDDLQYFSDLFIPRSKRLDDGEWVGLDPESAFACDYGGLMLLLVEHLNMNFASFFTDAASIWKVFKGVPDQSVSRETRATT